MVQVVQNPFPTQTVEIATSLLAHGFNKAWALALSLRDHNAITHWLMIHADVFPLSTNWLGMMFYEMQQANAQVLSVCLPIKNEQGLTSTALESGDDWRPRRLTTAEMQERPETWTDPELLINTGLMLVDFRSEWVRDICFTIKDRIVCHGVGQYEAQVIPEDWDFSRQLRARGVPFAVTRKVVAAHIGDKRWLNNETWGLPTDPNYIETQQRLEAARKSYS